MLDFSQFDRLLAFIVPAVLASVLVPLAITMFGELRRAQAEAVRRRPRR